MCVLECIRNFVLIGEMVWIGNNYGGAPYIIRVDGKQKPSRLDCCGASQFNLKARH